MVEIKARAYGRKANGPTVTTQVDICPIPFHYDTYVGCPHGCLYCFARDLVNFRRRKSPLAFDHTEINSVAHFHKVINRYLSRPIDYGDAVSVFLKNRVPLKIGAVADPCPPIERQNRLTYQTLRVLAPLDYPVQLQTKRPDIVAEWAADFRDWTNLIFSVTIIGSDEVSRSIEPGAPTSSERFAAIKRLTALGFSVCVACQPALYPAILRDLPWLVQETARSGAWAIRMEGLKLRIATARDEREHFQALGRSIGIDDLFGHYKANGIRTASDYEIATERKIEYLTLGRMLAHSVGLRFLAADNQPECIALSDSDECCGTERLHGYKKFAYNLRTKQTTGLDWPALENGLERAIFRTRAIPDGMTLKAYVDRKVGGKPR